MLNKVGVDSRLLGDLAHPRSLRSRKAENHKDGIYYDDCYREDHIDIILIGKRKKSSNMPDAVRSRRRGRAARSEDAQSEVCVTAQREPIIR
jgi:hypothetical protein